MQKAIKQKPDLCISSPSKKARYFQVETDRLE